MIKSTTTTENIQLGPDGQVYLMPSPEELTTTKIKEKFQDGITLSDSVLPEQFTLSNEFIIPSSQVSVFEKYESRFEYIFVAKEDYSGSEQAEQKDLKS